MIKKILNLLGIGVYRMSIHKRNKEGWIKEKGFNTVIDVGANVGQFAREIRSILPNARIISFEPIPECFEKILILSKKDQKMECYRYAIGEKDEKLSLNINESDATSSFFKSSEYLKSNFPFTKTNKVSEVDVKKLDSIGLDLIPPVLFKIDVQGYEKHVLLGALNSLRHVDTILVEVSYVELYQNQPLFDDIYKILIENDFVYAGNHDQIYSPKNGRILQGDSIFFKKNNYDKG